MQAIIDIGSDTDYCFIEHDIFDPVRRIEARLYVDQYRRFRADRAVHRFYWHRHIHRRFVVEMFAQADITIVEPTML